MRLILHMPAYCITGRFRSSIVSSGHEPIEVLVLGFAYKQDVDDYRESPALKVIDLLVNEGAECSYYDPGPHIQLQAGNMQTFRA